MLRFSPLKARLRKIRGAALPDITEQATDRWVIAPAERVYVAPAICLPGQIEKIRATEFAPREEVVRTFSGGFEAEEPPTIGYRLKDVDLVDGVLYAGDAQRHLRARRSRGLVYTPPTVALSGAMYESWLGNRWFGNWLSDDCLTHMLAVTEGMALTTTLSQAGHVPDYESLLGMEPRRETKAHFDELVLFDDLGNNAGKAERAEKMREKLLIHSSTEQVRGVFILRGRSGDARVLENEREIAENLARSYDFRVLDPAQASVAEIVALCGQAAVVAGVEGSHLVHGLVAMPRTAALLVIQPPERTVAALKILTDRRSQRYAFVVADGSNESFRVTWDDVQRTFEKLM